MTTKTSRPTNSVFTCDECHTHFDRPHEQCPVCGGSDLDVTAPAPKAKRSRRSPGTTPNPMTPEQIAELERTTREIIERQHIAAEADATFDEEHPTLAQPLPATADNPLAYELASNRCVNESAPLTRCPRCQEMAGWNIEQQACYACALNVPEGTALIAPKEGAIMTTATKTTAAEKAAAAAAKRQERDQKRLEAQALADAAKAQRSAKPQIPQSDKTLSQLRQTPGHPRGGTSALATFEGMMNELIAELTNSGAKGVSTYVSDAKMFLAWAKGEWTVPPATGDLS